MIGCAGIVACYVFSFLCLFEVLGDPVRSNAGQWLGPAKRINPQLIDIGKIYVYEGSDMAIYRAYRPLCLIWLWIMGF
ncbi:MAG: hypothetical protein QOK24_2026 [Verrucomicrobiota bacterium]